MKNRLVRVRELLKRELSSHLARDYVFQHCLVTVNSVDVTPDLKKGHAYIGIVGPEKYHQGIIDRLNHDHGAIQSVLARRVVLKFTPQLRFHEDSSVERGVRVVSLLQEIEDLHAADSPDSEADGEEGGGEAERGIES